LQKERQKAAALFCGCDCCVLLSLKVKGFCGFTFYFHWPLFNFYLYALPWFVLRCTSICQ